MKNKILCAIYTRVSTDNQAEIEFNSCESQKEKIEHFMKSQEGFIVYGIFKDAGYSGKDIIRPAMQRMLGEIGKGKINCVLTYKMDRLTRSPKDFYHLIEYFEKHNVNFISVTERFDISTPSGRLLRNMMLTFSQFERELARERTMDKLLQRAQKGMWNGGIAPFGFKRVAKKLVKDGRESMIVITIFQKYIETGSLTNIYNFLKKHKVYNRKHVLFSKSAISNILRNIIYTGKIKYCSKIYQGIHEPIVSEELFNCAQMIHKKAPDKMRKYRELLFSGLVKCSVCGSFMTPYYVSKLRYGQRVRYYYYRCTCTFNKDWTSCSVKQVSADKLEEYIFNNLKRISRDKMYIDSIIAKLNQEHTESSKGKAAAGSLSGQVEFVPDSFCDKLSPDVFRNNLINFISTTEKSLPIEKIDLIKKNIKRVSFSKEKIRVEMFYNEDGFSDENLSGCQINGINMNPAIGFDMYLLGNELNGYIKRKSLKNNLKPTEDSI